MEDDFLVNGLKHGFFNSDVNAESQYIPKFLTNNKDRGEKVITSLKHEMLQCDEFMFSVAFITDDGINSLLSEFKVLLDNNISGKIIASQYQNFTQPKALRKLLSFPNIELRIVTEEQMNMHSKCYIFRQGEMYDVIIGSSNLTNNALCSNGEWNLKVNSKESGEVIAEILTEFNFVFEHSTKVTEEWINGYTEIYYNEKRLREQLETKKVGELSTKPNIISPNKMQIEALENLKKIRDEGKDRALIISATGSGKTFLAAFDAKRFGGKVLYVVHRLPILTKSMVSFGVVYGDSKKVDRYNTRVNNIDADCIFATNYAMADAANLKLIPPHMFDYIIIDEVHHVGATTYETILNYFKPKFLMGMTATPDRSDDCDVYGVFNYNIAYDIRLRKAMEYKLICPFHYFGIHDIFINDCKYDDKTVFSKIEEEQRVDYIIENAEYYGHCEGRLKGLVFCNGVESAKKYSDYFNSRGYRTVWVSGDLKPEYVNTCIERLEADECEECLDYIFTADLFNEGVDIPSINQVIMLRPTKSPIIYIQQLGRGLRIHKDKSYVVVLDFIGNYENNFYIPLALSDDHSYNKSETRRFVSVGDMIIPGNSTISFDEVSKKQIFDSIDKVKLKNNRIIVDSYIQLKQRLGRIPRLIEYGQYGTIDALKIIMYHGYGSYHSFLKSKESKYDIHLSDEEDKLLKYITKIIAPGKRILEVEMLGYILSGEKEPIKKLLEVHTDLDTNSINNVAALFDGSFYRKKNHDPPILIDQKGRVTEQCSVLIKGSVRDHLIQVLELGKDNYYNNYCNLYKNTNFVLGKLYTYADVCRLLNWSKDVNGQNIGGYIYNSETNTFPVFINYEKGEDVKESIRYPDHFENRKTLIAVSKNDDDKDSKRMTIVRDYIKNGTTIHLFVRKNKKDEDSKEFYYLGIMDFDCFMDDGKPVTIRYKLRDEVRSDIYEYIVG